MDRIVSTNVGSDKKFGIDDRKITMKNIVLRDWIHMVDNDSTMDLIARNTEITPVISDNNRVSSMSPFSRAIKALIDPSIEPKGTCSYNTTEREVLKTFFVCFEPCKLRITPIPVHLP
jgi:hypothetical protein